MPLPNPTGLTSHFYTSQRLTLHYTDWGNEDAPPLILLHGGRDHSRSWDWVAERLRDRFHIFAPDLRGHGDSQWSPDGDYSMASHLLDLVELVDQRGLAPVTIVGHSLGGNIAVRYAGIYPENVARLVSIEGLGPSPQLRKEQEARPVEARFRQWAEYQRALSERRPRTYGSFEEALTRMRRGDAQLSVDQARHLTLHGLRRNADGSYAWKFDNYVRSTYPVDLSFVQQRGLWTRIACPTLLVYGADSWASNPAQDGRLDHFQSARVALVEQAGHWVHHDQLESFIGILDDFLVGG